MFAELAALDFAGAAFHEENIQQALAVCQQKSVKW
jgi:hypothetical protein